MEAGALWGFLLARQEVPCRLLTAESFGKLGREKVEDFVGFAFCEACCSGKLCCTATAGTSPWRGCAARRPIRITLEIHVQQLSARGKVGFHRGEGEIATSTSRYFRHKNADHPKSWALGIPQASQAGTCTQGIHSYPSPIADQANLHHASNPEPVCTRSSPVLHKLPCSI